MTVVFHLSAGKMISKGLGATLVFGLAWIKTVAGAPSYSNVYVQSGPSLTSLYGPAALTGAELAPLAASPLMSNVLPPCVSPCVIPGQRIAALTPVATDSANFVSYKSPISVPIVVAPTNDNAGSYEYSYVVYDEDTGDQKAQKELSDNGVIHGQYSLLQPNGYVREVQYTADDLRGFNAVVKNFLPKYALNTGTERKAIPPCPEVKKEPLKESLEGESHDLEPAIHPEQSYESQEEHSQPKNAETLKQEPKHKAPATSEDQVKTEGSTEHGKPKKEEEKVPGEVASHGKPEGTPEPESYESQGESESLQAKVEPVQEIPKEPKNNNEVKKEKTPRPQQSSEVKPDEVNALVSYNDVIKCLQAALKSVAPTASPLTYIILNKPC